MTESEVLEKLDFFKQAIQKLKEELEYWKEQALENPQEVCETEGWTEAWKKLNEERLNDAETISELRRKCEDFSNDFIDADLECDRLKVELERADSAYAKLAHKYHDDVSTNKKYTEEDLKKLLHKASEKTKQRISDLEIENDNLRTKCDNLEIANRSLDRELQQKQAVEEIDKVLEDQMTETEMDEILTKPTKTVKLEV